MCVSVCECECMCVSVCVCVSPHFLICFTYELYAAEERTTNFYFPCFLIINLAARHSGASDTNGRKNKIFSSVVLVLQMSSISSSV